MSSSADSNRDDDTSLYVNRALDGDEASLEWVIGRFSPLLLAQANQRMGPQLRRHYDPEDVVNDVWERALPRLPGLGNRDGRYTPVVVRFLSTTLLNRLNSLLQKRIVSASSVSSEGDRSPSKLADASSRAVTRIVRRERDGAVQAALADLPDEDRQIVLLRGIEQNPVQDVAVLLGLRPNTVSVRYRRALDKLRQRLPGSVFDEL